MPFIDAPQRPTFSNAPGGFQGIDLTPRPDPNDTGPTAAETFGAAFRLDSDIVGPLSSNVLGVDYAREDAGFDIAQELHGTKYESRIEFAGVRNREAMEAVKLQVDQEEKDRGILEASGALGVVAGLGAGLASWTLAIPGGALVKSARGGYSLAKSGLSVGAAAGVGAIASEATLQSTQVSRPLTDTATTIGGSVLLGGVLGAGLSRVLSAKQWTTMTARLEQEFAEPAVVGGGVARPASAGAARVDTGDSRLRNEATINKMVGLRGQDPLIRLQLSPFDSARQTVRGLAETSLEINANRQGFATAEGGAVDTRMKMWDADLGRSVSNLDEAYARYFLVRNEVGLVDRVSAPLRGAVQRGESRKLTFSQFKEAVSNAMRRDDTHEIPEVQEVAKAFRQNLFNRGRDAAIEAGIFDKSIADIEDGGYLHRLYNRERIIAQRPVFVERLTNYLESARVNAERREVEVEAARVAVELDERIQRVAREVEQRGRRLENEEAIQRSSQPSKREDFAAREAAYQREVDALRDLEKQFEAFDEGARSSRRVSMARDYATLSREIASKRAELARLNQKRIDHATAGNTNRVHEMDGRIRILEARVSQMEVRHSRLKAIVERSGRGTEAEVEELRQFTGLSRQELEGIADEVTDTILGNAEGRMVLPDDDLGSSPRGALRSRTLRIPDLQIEEFLESDIEKVARAYTRHMSADVELATRFGDVGLREPIRQINDEANALIARAKNEADRTRIHKEREAAIRDVEMIRDRHRGTFALPANPDGIIVRSGRVLRNLNYIRLLGGASISAIVDPGKIILDHGLTSVMRDGFLPMVRGMKTVRMAGQEAREAGTAWDIALDSRASALADINANYGRNTTFERGLEAVSSQFGMLSLLTPWTVATKQFASLVIINRFLRLTDEVAAGKATEKTLGILGAGNISRDMAARISGQFKKYGSTQHGSKFPNTGDWDDRQAVQAFRAMLVRQVDKAVITPGQEIPGLWSTEQGKLITQFKSFAASSTHKILFSAIQQRDAAVLSGLTAMLAMGAMSHLAYSLASGRDIEWTPGAIASNAIDRSGILGLLMEVNNISEKATSGRVGLSALSGEEVTRYQSRNALGALLGPSFGLVQDAFDVSASLTREDSELTGNDTHRMRQLLPFQNLFYIRQLLDQVENGFNDAFGIQRRKGQ